MSELPRARTSPPRSGLFGALSRLMPVRAEPPPGDAVQLVERAIHGDSEAQTELRARLDPVIRSRARTFLSRRVAQRIGVHDAEDLLQQVWVSLWRDEAALLRAYDPARGMGLEGYVGMIAQRELWHAAERLVAQKRSAEAPSSSGAPDAAVSDGASPERIVATRQLLASVDAFVREHLSERARQAYVLLYADGKTVEEVARLLGTNEQTVYNFQHEIRKHARLFMARYEDGDSSLA